MEKICGQPGQASPARQPASHPASQPSKTTKFGNTLLNYGTGGEIREVDLQGEILWSLQWGDGKTLGHTQLVEDLYALNRGP